MDKKVMPYSDEEKVAHFFREVGREFDRREKELVDEQNRERSIVLDKARRELDEELKAYKAQKLREFFSVSAGNASREILDLKHESLSLTESFLGEIRNALEKEIEAFTADREKYYAYLLSSCSRAVDFVGEGFDLYLSQSDAEKYADRLKADLDMECTVIPDENIKLGGARLCQNDRGISVDETLDEKLSDKISELAKSGI